MTTRKELDELIQKLPIRDIDWSVLRDVLILRQADDPQVSLAHVLEILEGEQVKVQELMNRRLFTGYGEDSYAANASKVRMLIRLQESINSLVKQEEKEMKATCDHMGELSREVRPGVLVPDGPATYKGWFIRCPECDADLSEWGGTLDIDILRAETPLNEAAWTKESLDALTDKAMEALDYYDGCSCDDCSLRAGAALLRDAILEAAPEPTSVAFHNLEVANQWLRREVERARAERPSLDLCQLDRDGYCSTHSSWRCFPERGEIAGVKSAAPLPEPEPTKGEK